MEKLVGSRWDPISLTRSASRAFGAARRLAPCSTGHCRPCSASSSRSHRRVCARNERARSTDRARPAPPSSDRRGRRWSQHLPPRPAAPPAASSPAPRSRCSDCPPPRWRSPPAARPSGPWHAVSLGWSSSSAAWESASERDAPVCCRPRSSPTSSGCTDCRSARSRSRTRGSSWWRPCCLLSLIPRTEPVLKRSDRSGRVCALSTLRLGTSKLWTRRSVFFDRWKIEDGYYDIYTRVLRACMCVCVFVRGWLRVALERNASERMMLQTSNPGLYIGPAEQHGVTEWGGQVHSGCGNSENSELPTSGSTADHLPFLLPPLTPLRR